jgi:RHS repeat-associated protein
MTTWRNSRHHSLAIFSKVAESKDLFTKDTRTGGFSAGYDSQNQLTAIGSGEDYGQFTYDGLGRCLKRTIDWETTLITYDGWQPIAEWDEWNNLKAWNVYGSGPDEILYRHDTVRGDLRYHLDRMGNVVFLLDSDGDGIERYTYDAFGHPTVTDWNGDNPRTWSAYGNRLMFTGREYFPELGLYDFRNRFYYPAIGRFLQSDPIGFDADDANIFRYCGGDPVNGSDPLGLDAVTERVTVTGAPVPVDYDRDDRPIYYVSWSVFDPLNDYLNSLFNDDRSRVDYVSAPVEPLLQPGANFSLGPALPSSPQTSAVYRVRQLLINLNTNRNNRKPGQLFISVYGSRFDPYSDSRTRLRIGADTTYHNMLTRDSLALSSDLKKAWGLNLGDPVYINGSYLGQFNDIAPQIFTIDVYDPSGHLGINWGGVLEMDYYLSNSPGP